MKYLLDASGLVFLGEFLTDALADRKIGDKNTSMLGGAPTKGAREISESHVDWVGCLVSRVLHQLCFVCSYYDRGKSSTLW